MFFGVAHAHHFMELRRKHPWQTAGLSVVGWCRFSPDGNHVEKAWLQFLI